MTPPRSKYDNGRQPAPIIERIKARCDLTPSGCWLWRGSSVKGYGRTKVGSKRDGSQRAVLTHVATWESLNGPKPTGMTLDHVVCDQPLCANPGHLALVTSWDNTRRSLTSPTAVNARKTSCPKCNGPLTSRPSGGRICRPCLLAYYREYNASRR